MEFITVADMKELEARNNAAGLSYEDMMENAGRGAAAEIIKRYSPRGKRVLVLCGRGSNGGDGLVSALHLAREGALVIVALPLGGPKTPEAILAFSRLEQEGKPPFITTPEETDAAISQADIILDCLFGTGFQGEVKAPAKNLMLAVNRSAAVVVSYDINSGVEADTGRYDCCIRSHMTIAFEALKPAHLVHWRKEYQRDVVVVPIGNPPNAPAELHSRTPAVDRDYFAAHRPVRKATGHKGDNGRLLVIAGSRNYRGAAALVCQAALRAGAGYVSLASVEEACALAVTRTPEVISISCPAEADGTLAANALETILPAMEKADALVLGCGLGISPSTGALVKTVLKAARVPVVLDADGLGVLAGNAAFLKESKPPLILTPHPGEFSRLFGVHIDKLLNNPFQEANTIAEEYGISLLLKGPFSIIADCSGHRMASFLGNSGLARGGSGDVLAGFIGAMAARGISPMDAAACGAYLHGRGADLAAGRLTQEAMLPTDVIEILPAVFGEFLGIIKSGHS